MSILGFIGLVLLITAFVGICIAYYNCKVCQEFETPEVDHEWHELPLTTQPKVYTTDCGQCVWRHPSICKQCAIERNDAKMEISQIEEIILQVNQEIRMRVIKL